MTMKIEYVWLDNGCCDENGMGIDVFIALSDGRKGFFCLDSKKDDPLFAEIIANRANSDAKTDGDGVYWENGARLSLDEILDALELFPSDDDDEVPEAAPRTRETLSVRGNAPCAREREWREMKPRIIELSEGKLELVAGGTAAGITGCHFEPALPLQHDASGVAIRVRCSANCYIPTGTFTEKRCICHGTDRCVGAMHTVEKYGDGVYVASPAHEYGHADSGKLIHGLMD